MLRYYGHDAVAILAGGLPAWQAAGQPVTTDVPHYPPALFSVRTRPTLRASRDEVIAASEGRSAAQLVETQRDGTYAQRDQDIPKSVRLSASALLEDARGGRIAERARLDELIASAGLDRTQRTIVSCGSGVGAAGAYLATDRRGLHRRGGVRRLLDGMEPRPFADRPQSARPLSML